MSEEQMEFDDPLLLETADENRRRCNGRTTKGIRCKRTRPEWDQSQNAWKCRDHA
jgi:hypothetical protein